MRDMEICASEARNYQDRGHEGLGRIAMSESEDTDIIPAPSSIVRAPSEITRVNSSLAKTVIPSEDSLARVTYYNLILILSWMDLIPDPLPESGGKDNAIHHLNIMIFGKPNTGKCLTGDDVMPTTDGSIVRVGNLDRLRWHTQRMGYANSQQVTPEKKSGTHVTMLPGELGRAKGESPLAN